jgi:predicted DNA-binding transcriptional regulator AlpA
MTRPIGKRDPIFATAATAAQMLDMKLSDFNDLVQAGHLPRPCRIGHLERFDMEELARIMRGDLIGGLDADMKW